MCTSASREAKCVCAYVHVHVEGETQRRATDLTPLRCSPLWFYYTDFRQILHAAKASLVAGARCRCRQQVRARRAAQAAEKQKCPCWPNKYPAERMWCSQVCLKSSRGPWSHGTEPGKHQHGLDEQDWPWGCPHLLRSKREESEPVTVQKHWGAGWEHPARGKGSRIPHGKRGAARATCGAMSWARGGAGGSAGPRLPSAAPHGRSPKPSRTLVTTGALTDVCFL